MTTTSLMEAIHWCRYLFLEKQFVIFFKKYEQIIKTDMSSLRHSLWNLVPFHSWRQQELIANAICFAWRIVSTCILWSYVQEHTYFVSTTAYCLSQHLKLVPCKNSDFTPIATAKSINICRHQLENKKKKNFPMTFRCLLVKHYPVSQSCCYSSWK